MTNPYLLLPRLMAPPALLLAMLSTGAPAQPPVKQPAQPPAKQPDQPPVKQEEKQKLQLLFSTEANDPKPSPNFLLRPNLTQPIFVYVQNPNETEEEVTIELTAGETPVAGMMQKIKVAGNRTQQVDFGKAAPPPPAPAAAAPPAVPVPAATGPALTELKGNVKLRLKDDSKLVHQEVDIKMARPDQYVKVTAIRFRPAADGMKNQLLVEVEADDTFSGSECRVDLVLRPDRIPGFLKDQKKEGVHGGHLTRAGDKLLLVAENLQFESGAGDKGGLIYLTIDGYERAFTYNATSLRENTAGTPNRVEEPLLRLEATPYSLPTAKYAVTVEIDNNLDPGNVAELSVMGLKLNGEALEEGEIQRIEMHGDRRLKLLASTAGPNGAILLRAEPRDWTQSLDLRSVFGPRTLRLRLVGPVKQQVTFDNSATYPDKVTQIVESIVLDASKPENVKFVNFPAKLNRSAPLPIQAVGNDPESGIQQVVFFAGKLLPDGKLPPNTLVAEGKLIDPEQHLYAAQLPVNTDAKGKVELSVQFTNRAGLTATETIVIQLVDPPPPEPKKPEKPTKASIEGTVVEGGRAQPNLTVTLRDDKGAVRDTTQTNIQGKFVFKELNAGAYQVSANKTASSTRGTTSVQVDDGQKKTGVEIKLTR